MELHQGIVNALVMDEGFSSKGMLKHLRQTLCEAHSYMLGEPVDKDVDGNLVLATESYIKEIVREEILTVTMTPDAWRVVKEKDEDGIEWTIYELVEVEITHLTEDQLRKYAKLWFVLDAAGVPVSARLTRIDKTLTRTPIDLKYLFFVFNAANWEG